MGEPGLDVRMPLMVNIRFKIYGFLFASHDRF